MRQNPENLATKYRESLFWHHPSWNVSLRPSWQIPSSSTCYIQFTSLLKFLRTTEVVLSGVRLECILLLLGSWPQLAFSGKGKFDAIGLPEVGNLLHFNCWEFSSCEMWIFVRVLVERTSQVLLSEKDFEALNPKMSHARNTASFPSWTPT